MLELQNHTPPPAVTNEIGSNFYNRPYKVIMADGIVDVLRSAIVDKELRGSST